MFESKDFQYLFHSDNIDEHHTLQYDRSLTHISQPSYYDKIKRTNRKGLDIRKIMTRYGSSLTPTIVYDTIGLSHPSYYNKTKKTNRKGLDIR